MYLEKDLQGSTSDPKWSRKNDKEWHNQFNKVVG